MCRATERPFQSIMNKKEIYESVANSGIGWVDWIFDRTVDLLILLGKETGLGYTGINVLILIIVLLIIFLSIGLNIYLFKKLKKNSFSSNFFFKNFQNN